MSKIYVATLHTGNTLTIHGKTFFKGKPEIVEDERLIEWIGKHRNFKLEAREVQASTTPEKVIQETREQMKKDGEYVAPSVFGENTAADAGAAATPVAEKPAEAASPRTSSGKNAAPRPTRK